MTISELKKLSRGRWNGSMKRTVVQQWHMGLLTLKEIVLTLKINRRTFRQWVRWEYISCNMSFKTGALMSSGDQNGARQTERVAVIARFIEQKRAKKGKNDGF